MMSSSAKLEWLTLHRCSVVRVTIAPGLVKGRLPLYVAIRRGIVNE